jgi:hypothetical protein
MAAKIDEYGGWRGLLLYSLLSAVISSAMIAGVLKWMFDKELESWRTVRSWQLSALSEVIAPAVMHFERTKALAERYRRTMFAGEAVLLRESNATIRNLLLSKAHLLPSELVAPSQCLLTHYDIWLKRYDFTLEQYMRSHGSQPTPLSDFDVGFSELEDPKCGDFPEEVPGLFRAQFNKLRKELYDLPAS